jgi:hypothetical protein
LQVLSCFVIAEFDFVIAISGVCLKTLCGEIAGQARNDGTDAGQTRAMMHQVRNCVDTGKARAMTHKGIIK